MELLEIKMSDIIPDENNPREKFNGLHEMAKGFEMNPYAPGQPFNAIVVVRDGEFYRIADGERRYRAMEINGIDECNAIVCGDYDEADSIIAMLASDDKETLSEVERAKGIQRALMLGIKPQTVEKIGRLKSGQAKRIKDVMGSAKEIRQATIDQLLTAADLRDQGVAAETVDRILDAEQDDWEILARDAKAKLKVQKYKEDASMILAEAGFTLDDKRPNDLVYAQMFHKLDTLKEYLAEKAEEDTHFWICEYPLCIEVFKSVSDVGIDDDDHKDDLLEEIDKAKAILEEGEEARYKWYAATLECNTKHDRILKTPHVDAYLVNKASKSMYAEDFRDEAASELPKTQPQTLYGSSAEVLYELFREDALRIHTRSILKNDVKDYEADVISDSISFISACIEDGFKPSEAEIDLLNKACACLITDKSDASLKPIDLQEDTEEDEEDALLESQVVDEATLPSIEPEPITSSEIIIPFVGDTDDNKNSDEIDLSSLVLDGNAVA